MAQTGGVDFGAEWKGQDLGIAPQGDVIAVLNYKLDEPGAVTSKARIRIDSRVLQAASEVFGAMFKPYFGGANLTPDMPKDIPFPKDDAKPMVVLFRVLHFQHGLLTTPDSRGSPLEFAIVVDKYDCAESVALFWAGWMRSVEEMVIPQPDVEDRNKTHDDTHESYMAAAWEGCFVLFDEDNFRKISKRMIVDSRCSVLVHLAESQCLPKTAYLHLEVKREDLRLLLLDLIEGAARVVGKSGYRKIHLGDEAHSLASCPRQRKKAVLLLDELERVDLWPTHTMPFSIRSMLHGFARLENVDVTDLPACTNRCEDKDLRVATESLLGLVELDNEAQFQVKKVDGLCLKCVMEQEKRGKDANCAAHGGENTVNFGDRRQTSVRFVSAPLEG